MGSVEGKIKKERALYIFANKLRGFTLEKISGITFLLNVVIAPHERRNAVPCMRPVVDACIGEAIEKVEAALQRQKTFRPATIPFANDPRRVTGIFQNLADGDFAQIH